MKKAFKFLLTVDGSTVLFAVLEQPEEWRCPDGRIAARTMPNDIEIRSNMEPAIICDEDGVRVYLLGSRVGNDNALDREGFSSHAEACNVAQRVREALIEFANTGGFTPKEQEPASQPDNGVTTIEVEI